MISPTMDDAIVDAVRRQLLEPHVGRPGMHAYVAEIATQFIAEQVGRYGTRASRTREQAQAAYDEETCVHCGRDGVGTYARGYGYADGPLCHPNDDGPDCYTLVTLYKHPTPCDCAGDLGPDYDPTDADLEPGWNAVGWSEQNERVMRVVRDLESGAL